MVDNGAAEDDREPFELIVKAAKHIQAHEVAMPDVLFDARATLAATLDPYYLALVPPKQRMIIPQGATPAQWIENMHDLVNGLRGQFSSIGIPKHMERHAGGRASLLRNLKATKPEWFDWTRHAIHLLGVYGNPQQEIAAALQTGCPIRGVDSGCALAYAHANIPLTGKERASLVWSTTWDPQVYARAAANISQMMTWCNHD